MSLYYIAITKFYDNVGKQTREEILIKIKIAKERNNFFIFSRAFSHCLSSGLKILIFTVQWSFDLKKTEKLYWTVVWNIYGIFLRIFQKVNPKMEFYRKKREKIFNFFLFRNLKLILKTISCQKPYMKDNFDAYS